MFMLRFDMRAPADGPAGIRDLYTAAIEMSAWAEKHGALSVVVSEHHSSPDGYLPSPLILATAIATRTTTVPITVAALLVPLYDPIKLAEDMAVLDVISGGRVAYIAGLGYRPEEYAMFGQSMSTRGRRMEECLTALRTAWTGEPFEFEGRAIRVTPQPTTPGGPFLMYGGGTPAAARRAARFGLGFFSQTWAPGLEDAYNAECERVGTAPGMCFIPARGSATSLFIAKDVDRAWYEIGPFMLHDAQMYAAWLGDAAAASKSNALTVDSLRDEAGAYRILTPDQAVEYVHAHGALPLHPLCGGCPPELAWESLNLVADEVLPALA
ncbi:MAG TPA: LLM class flavin-dependent oxidoreductase [Acidimicrobiia bacterium]|jgi:alkanesulfonate monooxygenase SsuD/methylene tetrahydromethanopterin reductase-like flavin-dependent oxidoreductase (luciferase family)|nr:LLM class flavin-dependent oxidoreductase [Acidimicrobiia bacterium]